MNTRIELNPIVLEEDVVVFEKRFRNCLQFVKHLNIDFIDWRRTENKTITVEDVFEIFDRTKEEFSADYDLMLDYPSSVVKKLAEDKHTRSIAINLESKEEINQLIGIIRSYNKWVGISVNPENDIEKYKEILEKIDLVNVLTVFPGKQGSEFVPDMLWKADKLKEMGFKGHISIDGGVSKNNIVDVLEHPFDIITVGSAIVKQENPEQSYLDLLNIINSKQLE